MKIRVNDFWLCQADQLAPNSLRVDSRRVVQIAQRLRAISAEPFARGNTVRTISFTVVREHDSVRDAEAFLVEHEAAIPSSGIVEITCHDDAGPETVFYFDAEIEAVSAGHVGLSTEHAYTLVGGLITKDKPES